MKQSRLSRRVKMFGAVSLASVLAVALVLVLFLRDVALDSLTTRFGEQNYDLAQNLLSELRRQGLLPVLLSLPADATAGDLKARPEVQRVRDFVTSAVAGLDILKVKIFDKAARIVFSTESTAIGNIDANNAGVNSALAGEPVSNVVHRDTFNAFDRIVEDRDLFQHYIPILNDIGRVEGVFELYTDVSPLIADSIAAGRRVLAGVLFIMGVFFAVLFWLFARLDRALQLREQQREDYLKQIEEANEVLEERVRERTAELEQAGNFLQSVIDGIENPLVVIGEDLRVRSMNRAARAQIPAGRALETVRCFELSHRLQMPCTAPDHPCSFAEVMQTGNAARLIHRHPDEQGDDTVVQLITSPLRQGNGSVVGVIEVEHDITELVHARDQLRISEMRIRSIMDSVGDAIMTVDAEDRVETCNRAASRMFGQPVEELIGKDFGQLVPAWRDAVVESGLSARSAIAGNVEGVAAGGDTFPAELWVGPLEQTRHGETLVVVRDATERRRAEQELEQTRQQYFHQEKMAAVGQLAAGILHEVGNPIAAIAGAIHELRDRQLQGTVTVADDECLSTTDVEHLLDQMEEQTERLAAITREIADFSSPRPRERELLDLNTLIRSTMSLLRHDRRLKDVEQRLLLDRSLPAVTGVADQLTQVLMNLVLNAVDACMKSDQSQHVVEVETRSLPAAIQLRVRDNGVGMDARTLAHATEPFFTTKATGQGTGLGLSLSQSIVEAHGGTLRISSTPGEGTEVCIELPLQDETRAC